MSGFFDVVFENDDFTVNVVSEFLKSFSDLESVDRTEDGACCAGLCSDGEAYAFESGGESFSFSLDLCELVGALTLVFCKNLQRRFGGDDSLSLRDEVVTAIPVLYFNYIVLVSKVGDVFFKNYLHNVYCLLKVDYFIKSVT